MEIYLDNAATTKVFPEILNQLKSYYEEYFANPNAIYPPAQKTRTKIEQARKYIASILNTQEENIVFTSGATESNNTIIRGFMENSQKKEILLSPIEHKSVLAVAKYLAKKGYTVKFLKIDKNGKIDLDHIKDSISDQTALVCIIHANNETGVVQDLKQIKQILNEKEIPLFSDTVQSFLKVEDDFEAVDFLSVSGHKINSVKGIGFLCKKKDISPLIYGGGQEFGLRSGTQNSQGILALYDAVRIWVENKKQFINRLSNLQKTFETQLKKQLPEVKIVSEDVKRVSSITCVIFPKVDAQSLIMALGNRGIYVSSGSACSSGTPTPSQVLLSYGFSEEEALRAVRVSFGIFNTEEEVKEAVYETVKVFKELYTFL